MRCDAAGLPVEITDPLGGDHPLRARRASAAPYAVTDPLGATTRLEWTVEGNSPAAPTRTARESPGRTTARATAPRHVDAGGGVTTYEYTHFDLLAARTGPDGARYEFDHDAELRLTKVTNPQGLTWTYAYDPAGRLIAETDFDDRTAHLRATTRQAN